MFCKDCGSEIDDNATFCPNCGASTENCRPTNRQNQTNTIAIVGFILSFFIAIAGLVCSIIGYRKANELNGSGKGFALAGIIISAISIIIAVLIYASAFNALLP